jgi:hypothetical protein
VGRFVAVPLHYYDETDRYTHFLHHGWVGCRLAPGRRLRDGVHQVPVGNLPYNSHSYFFSLACYMGLEDDYDLGIKHTDRRGSWRFDLAWYRCNLENPPGQADNAVVMGAYDFPYRVAAESMLHSIGVSYHWDVEWGRVTGITTDEDYSVLRKPEAGFEHSMQKVVGVSIDAAPFFLYTDSALGQHNAWIGRDVGTALAGGGDDDDLNVRVNLNMSACF